MIDEPRSLENPEEITARHKMLEDDHIRPLTQFVEKIRKDKNLSNEVPFIDPMGGGVNARCLCVLQDPGRKTQVTGLVSRNNPDPTARNIFTFYQEANIPREETIIWNVVPWVVKNDKDFWRSFDQGVRYLKELISLLPELKIIILHGNKAKYAKSTIEKEVPTLKFIDSWHTSNQSLNSRPKYREQIRAHLKEIYKLLYE